MKLASQKDMSEHRTFTSAGSCYRRGALCRRVSLHLLVWLLAFLMLPRLVPYAYSQEAASSGPRGPNPRISSTAGGASDHPATASDRTPDRLRFSVATSQVLVPVTVTDGGGHAVAGLTRHDFHLYEDGLEQDVDLLLDKDTPLTLAVVVDVSGSMRSKIRDAASALRELLDALGPRDRAFLLGFHRWVDPLQELTRDHALLADALSHVEPTGGTAMFDGIVEGLYRLYKMGPETRRALVLLSDGFDNASINTPHETIAAAKATGVPIYAIGLGKTHKGFLTRIFGDPMNVEFESLDENRLRELAGSTGGRAYIVSDIKRNASDTSSDPLALAFGRLARELRLHYVLTYSPPASELDGQWHAIRVELSQPDLFARFRPGYLALPLE